MRQSQQWSQQRKRKRNLLPPLSATYFIKPSSSTITGKGATMNQCKIFEMPRNSQSAGSIFKGGKGGVYDLYPEGNTLIKVIRTEFSEQRFWRPPERSYRTDIENLRASHAQKNRQKLAAEAEKIRAAREKADRALKELEMKITSAKEIASFIKGMRERRKDGKITLEEATALTAIKERLMGDEKGLESTLQILSFRFSHDLSLPEISMADLDALLPHAAKTADTELASAIRAIKYSLGPVSTGAAP